MISRIFNNLRVGVLKNYYRTPCYNRMLSNEGVGRLLIGFTCNICNKRTHRAMSKHAYTKGIVLIECTGCQNRHLIADNLGWFGQQADSRTIEDILSKRGETVRSTWNKDEEGNIMEILGIEAATKGTDTTKASSDSSAESPKMLV